MVGAYVFKTLNSDRPCVFDYQDQTNHVTHKSVSDLLKAPSVASVQPSLSNRVSGPKLYNVIPLSIRNSWSYQTFTLKYKHFLRQSNNWYLILHYIPTYANCSVDHMSFLYEVSDFCVIGSYTLWSFSSIAYIV